MRQFVHLGFFTFCLYLSGFSAQWTIGIPAAILTLWALYTLFKASKFMFAMLAYAYFHGVSPLWLLGIPVGLFVILILYYNIPRICRKGQPRRHYCELGGRRSEEAPLLARYTGTPGRTISSQILPVSQPSIGAASRAHPSLYTSRSAQIDPQSYSHVPALQTKHPRFEYPTTQSSKNVPKDQSVRVAAQSSTLPMRNSPVHAPRPASQASAVTPFTVGTRGTTPYATPCPPPPAIVNTTLSGHASRTTGSSKILENRLVCGTQLSAQPFPKIPVKTPQPEVDGEILHAAVTEQIGVGQYTYDRDIKTESAFLSRHKYVTGSFKCYGCISSHSRKKEPYMWSSVRIYVKIWMSSRRSCRYRTRLYSQLCGRCHATVEPEVEKDDYVTKVVQVLDRWAHRESALKPLQEYHGKGPHKPELCHACKKGLCHNRPQGSKTSGPVVGRAS